MPVEGPIIWNALHCAAMDIMVARPSTIEDSAVNLIARLLDLRTSLSCDECRAHYNAYVDAHPLPLVRTIKPQTLYEWVNDCHNDVNRRNGKPLWSLAQSVKRYE